MSENPQEVFKGARRSARPPRAPAPRSAVGSRALAPQSVC